MKFERFNCSLVGPSHNELTTKVGGGVLLLPPPISSGFHEPKKSNGAHITIFKLRGPSTKLQHIVHYFSLVDHTRE